METPRTNDPIWAQQLQITVKASSAMMGGCMTNTDMSSFTQAWLEHRAQNAANSAGNDDRGRQVGKSNHEMRWFTEIPMFQSSEPTNFIAGDQTAIFLRRNFFASKIQQNSESVQATSTFHAPTLVSNWLCAQQTHRRNEREMLVNTIKESNGTKNMLTVFDRRTEIPSDLEVYDISYVAQYCYGRVRSQDAQRKDEATTARFAEKIQQILGRQQGTEPIAEAKLVLPKISPGEKKE